MDWIIFGRIVQGILGAFAFLVIIKLIFVFAEINKAIKCIKLLEDAR